MSSPSDTESDFEEIAETTWRKMRVARFKDGFADGKYMGEESSVQEAFNNGYEVGFRTSFQVAVLKGVLGALEANLKEINSAHLKEAMMLKKEVSNLEQLCIEAAKRNIAEGSDRSLLVLSPLGQTTTNKDENCMHDDTELAKLSKDLHSVKQNTLELLKKCSYDGLMKIIDDI